MADIFSAEKRSEIMSRIRSTGSKPEERLYEIVRGILGHRWRIDRNVNTLPGRPDIVIPSLKLIIYADGCFYHSCPKHRRTPKTNECYWGPKLERNMKRDRVNRRRLRELGYSVWRVWEHDLKKTTSERTLRTLSGRLAKRSAELGRHPAAAS